MQSEVLVTLSPGQEFRLSTEGPTLSNEQARRWLDDEFTRLDCEPLRASGKVLLADREWSSQFARAAVAALTRPVVRVDVAAMAVTF